MSCAVIEQVKGATFSYAGTVTLPEGTWTGACSLRQGAGGAIVGTITLTLTGATTPYNLMAYASAAETANWPIGTLVGDFRFTDSATVPNVIVSPKFQIKVVQGVTP